LKIKTKDIFMIVRSYRNFVSLLFASLILLPGVAFSSDDDAEAAQLIAELEMNRRLVIDENMNLSPNEATAFWEVYDSYRRDLAGMNADGFKLLSEFRDNFEDLDDKRSDKILQSYFELQQKELVIRKKYVKKFNKVISPKQTLRFYQIENKLQSIIESDISSVTPLVP